MRELERDNNFNEKQIRGIDMTIKSIARRFPFIKGWELTKDYTAFKAHVYINLLVDFDEMADFYNTEIHPIWLKSKNTVQTSVPFTIFTLNPMNHDYNSSEYKEFFEKSYEEGKKIKESINTIYSNLPEEFRIRYPWYDKFTDKIINENCYLTIDNFKSI